MFTNVRHPLFQIALNTTQTLFSLDLFWFVDLKWVWNVNARRFIVEFDAYINEMKWNEINSLHLQVNQNISRNAPVHTPFRVWLGRSNCTQYNLFPLYTTCTLSFDVLSFWACSITADSFFMFFFPSINIRIAITTISNSLRSLRPRNENKIARNACHTPNKYKILQYAYFRMLLHPTIPILPALHSPMDESLIVYHYNKTKTRY